MLFVYQAGGTTDLVTLSSQSDIDWVHVMLTWDVSGGGEFKAYKNGSQAGTTQTALGTWSGALATTTTLIGAASTTPTLVMDGYLAHWFCLNRVATAGENAQVATR